VNKFAIVFFSQFIKMLIASMVLVYFFRKLLVFPLVDVQNQLLSMNFEKDELRIPHRWSMGKEDELDGMFKSVQMMIAKVRGSQNELKKLNSELDNLAHQRAEIIVSQRKMIEESERFASLGKMAGGIAHEINTPLAAAWMRELRAESPASLPL
jgi:C4-dicarboxylate-specific signal transduction histidine kinase